MEELKITKAPKILTDRYMLEPLVFVSPRRHFLSEIFDHKIQQLLEGHFFAYYLSEGDNIDAYYEKNKQQLPFKILTLGELEAGFVISISPLILCILVFCFEWMITIIKLLILKAICGVYFEVKEKDQNKFFEKLRINTSLLKLILEEKNARETLDYQKK